MIGPYKVYVLILIMYTCYGCQQPVADSTGLLNTTIDKNEITFTEGIVSENGDTLYYLKLNFINDSVGCRVDESLLIGVTVHKHLFDRAASYNLVIEEMSKGQSFTAVRGNASDGILYRNFKDNSINNLARIDR